MGRLDLERHPRLAALSGLQRDQAERARRGLVDRIRDMAHRFDGEVIHVRSTAHHGTIKLWLRAENDLENRMDCYEAFCDFEVEETGEKGTGTAEYSVMPAWPQWLA